MNDGQINTAIAESMGWTDIRPSEKWGLEGRHRDITRGSLLCDIPDYADDLNAMYEVEEVMMINLNKFWRYSEKLNALNTDLGLGGGIHTTAAQRAEAYLKTIGKWETE